MEFRVLGPVEVTSRGEARPLPSARQRTVLAVLLAAEGEAISAERLIEALWGDAPPPKARKTLRSHVSLLRRDLGRLESSAASAVVTVDGGYRLDLTDHDLDAARFVAHTDRAGADLPDAPAAALRVLDDALGRWRGPAYGELADHELVRADALRLEQRRAAASADRIDALLALGRHDAATAELEARVAADPLDERAHAQLMLARYRTGRQAEALEIHRRLRERLRDELGVDPSPATARLHERILRHDAALTPSTRAEIAATRASSSDAQPPPSLEHLGPLIGRDQDTDAVATLVASERQVTLTGPGGVGKSRLGNHVANEVAERFPGGVIVCSLSAISDPDDVTTALADALGLEPTGTVPAEESVVAALGARRMLVLFDGCEHVLPGVARLVETLLERSPDAAVLATSREPLRVPGERVWQVAPLPTPRWGADAAEVADSPAGALFAARAEAADPGFALTDAEAGAVAEICHRLDGLPLAIELAAVRVRAMTPEQLAARLDRRFSVLTGGSTREGGRHRTLEAMVAWSYDVLDEPEARLFDRLSVFADTFDLAAAEHVCAGTPVAQHEVAGRLAELVDRSMVVVERAPAGDVRYRLLDTLREFGRERLATTGEALDVRRAHAAYHVARVEGLGPAVRGVQEAAAVAAIEGIVGDLRAAHDWLVHDADVDGALRLPAALHEYLLFRPRAEVFTWVERALSLPGATSRPAYPDALATGAYGATLRGDADRARRYAEAALARADPHGIAAVRATAALSNAALYEGRLEDVVLHGEQLAALAEAVGSPYYRALAVLDPALALLYRGDTEAATTRTVELERAAELADNPTASSWVRYVQGEMLLETDPTTARQRFEEAIDLARRGASRLPEGVALVSLASSCGRNGETHRALTLFRDAIVHWRRLGDHTHQLTTVRNLVEFLARLEPTPATAVLHGAVSSASPPTFGAEADRLADAWRRLTQHLGPKEAAAAARRGRMIDPARLADEALAALDELTTVGELAVGEPSAEQLPER